MRENNIRVFKDTKKLCKTSKILIDAIEESNIEQQVITENTDMSDMDREKYEEPAKIIISKKRTLEAAEAYKGMWTCVHNFASATNAGGGVEKGSTAQEEAICRCSTLFFNLTDKYPQKHFYRRHRGALTPIYNDDCIYTPNVMVFKTDTKNPKLMPEEDWYKVNVVTCAAPNLRSRPSNAMNPNAGTTPVKIKNTELRKILMKRIRRILDVAVSQGNEVVVLGAFGCGAFQNPPMIVAEAFAMVIKDYLHSFETIEFAIYCNGRETENYDVFKRVLSRYCR